MSSHRRVSMPVTARYSISISRRKSIYMRRRSMVPDQVSDGGWGWVCVFACAFNMGTFRGLAMAFSIVNQAMQIRYQATATATSWVYSFFALVLFMSGKFCSSKAISVKYVPQQTQSICITFVQCWTDLCCNIAWRQDSSLVAWFTQSRVVPSSSPAAANIYPWCTHMQWPKLFKLAGNNDNRTAPHKKRTKNKGINMINMSRLTCKRSIKPLKPFNNKKAQNELFVQTKWHF